MNIRPSYEKPEQFTREDMKTMSASEIADAVKGGHFRDILRPSLKSCCEEAQLTANELARRNEELSESEDEIAALTKRVEKAEAERDELQARLDAAEKSRDRWIEKAHDLQCELDYRPTLNRGAVELSIARAFGSPISTKSLDTAVNAIMALVPAEGWQERLGTKPASEFLGGGWARWNSYPFARQKGDEILIGSAGDGVYEVNAAEAREFARCLLGAAERTEQDQRVEEVAERATEALVKTILDLFNVEDSDGAARVTARAIVREARDAGWTPPNNPV